MPKQVRLVRTFAAPINRCPFSPATGREIVPFRNASPLRAASRSKSRRQQASATLLNDSSLLKMDQLASFQPCPSTAELRSAPAGRGHMADWLLPVDVLLGFLRFVLHFESRAGFQGGQRGLDPSLTDFDQRRLFLRLGIRKTNGQEVTPLF